MADTVPPWLNTMRAMTGLLEEPGAADNPKILAMAAEIGRRYPDMAAYCATYKHDSIPWCGLAAAYVMAVNGIRPVNEFLWADNWRKFGRKIDNPQLGCVLVFSREGGNHVTLYEGEEGDSYVVRGGNQSDSINVTRIPKARLTGMAIPAEALPPVIATPALSTGRQTGIVATVFSSAETGQPGAYGLYIDDAVLGVALPAAFKAPRPQVRVYGPAGSAVADIVDKGPWYDGTAARPADPYWTNRTRPRAETDPRATSKAGIDLTPALARAVGISGKGLVDWEFVGAELAPDVLPPVATAANPLQAAIEHAVQAAVQAAVTQLATELKTALTSASGSGGLLQRLPGLLSILMGQSAPAPPPPPAVPPAKTGLGTGIVGLVGSVVAGMFGQLGVPGTEGAADGASSAGILLPAASVLLGGLGATGKVDTALRVVGTLGSMFSNLLAQARAGNRSA